MAIVKVESWEINGNRIFPVKRGTENKPGNTAIYLMRSLRGGTLLKTGSEFDLAGHSSASSVPERTGKRLQDRKFRKRIEKIRGQG